MEDILLHFYSHNIIVKTYHFTTLKYGHHKACDSYLENFSSLFDKYMETAQGLDKRVNINSMSFTLNFPQNIDQYIDTFIDYIKKIRFNTKEACLINILDDIIQNAGQFKYLLTLN